MARTPLAKMSQRTSGYDRIELDAYETPEWVTEALLPHIPQKMSVWEPAAGSGKMVGVLESAGHLVLAGDILKGFDFLTLDPGPATIHAVITNPPYLLAQEVIEHAMECAPLVAMLLRTDYDHAKTRRHLFGNCKTFAKKIVLTKRIVWFERKGGAAPSFNHAWYIWDRRHEGPPTLAYH